MVILSPLSAGSFSACDACGWAAAFMSMLGFGSFGAPIKSVSVIIECGWFWISCHCFSMVTGDLCLFLCCIFFSIILQDASKSVDIDPLVFQSEPILEHNCDLHQLICAHLYPWSPSLTSFSLSLSSICSLQDFHLFCHFMVGVGIR